jgi:uncharacterized protein
MITEVPRALARRAAPGVRRSALDRGILALVPALNLLDLSRRVLVAAASFGDPGLRALDAIHIASALRVVSGIDAFASYDRRQLAAARAAGLSVASPR